MDKNTLSHYGWAIIILIIIAIMLALATPFGSYVKNSVGNTIAGFGEKIATDLDADVPESDITGGVVVNPGDKITNNSISLMCNNSKKMSELFYSATEIIFEEGLPDYKNFSEDIVWRDFTDPSVINTGGRVLLYMDKNDKILHVCSKEGKIYLPADSASLFSAVEVKKINFNNLVDTSLVTCMDYMFDFSALEEEVDFSDFDTSNVTSMVGFFRNYNLPTVDLTSFNFDNLKNVNYMFKESKLTKLDVSKFKGEQIVSGSRMLDDCFDLRTITYKDKTISHQTYVLQYNAYHSFTEVIFTFDGTFEEFPLVLKKIYYRTYDIPVVTLKCSDSNYSVEVVDFGGFWQDASGNNVEVNYG